MLENILAIREQNPNMWGWVYRNGIKALVWHTTVRELIEDKSQWGLFMPLKGCMPSPGEYVCGPNATQNLYHDFEQTPKGDCGEGVECGEYVFNHRNASLLPFLLGEYTNFLLKRGPWALFLLASRLFRFTFTGWHWLTFIALANDDL